jgi:hypothetical protein
MANVEGKATAITVITPVKPWGKPVLKLVFWAGRNLTFTLKKLEQLSFIHFARWAVIERFPDGGAGERMHHSYLFFESNFNGTWDQYIDAFSEVVPSRMKAIWGSSYGFPGPIPVEPFKAYIRRNEYVANHYWSAYPGASASEIVAGGRVAAELAGFMRRADHLPPDAFARAYAELLTDLQGDM